MAMSHQAADRDGPAHRRRGLLPVGEAGEHGLDHFVEGQSAADVQLGGEPDLGVDDVIGGQILHTFGSDPMQGRWCRLVTATVWANGSR